jgi:nitrite reductase/ring-hydroxylating ferredoxin subunit
LGAKIEVSMTEKTLRVCNVRDIGSGSVLFVKVEDVRGGIAIYNADGTFFATSDVCTHLGASLFENGEIDGYTVTCSWHDCRFDVRTGASLSSLCRRPLKTYAAEIRDDSVYIRLQVSGA